MSATLKRIEQGKEGRRCRVVEKLVRGLEQFFIQPVRRHDEFEILSCAKWVSGGPERFCRRT
jgi:hypothetical protein